MFILLTSSFFILTYIVLKNCTSLFTVWYLNFNNKKDANNDNNNILNIIPLQNIYKISSASSLFHDNNDSDDDSCGESEDSNLSEQNMVNEAILFTEHNNDKQREDDQHEKSITEIINQTFYII